jgi:hypothetical protein
MIPQNEVSPQDADDIIYVRHSPNRPVMVERSTINDASLSWGALGLLIYIDANYGGAAEIDPTTLPQRPWADEHHVEVFLNELAAVGYISMEGGK